MARQPLARLKTGAACFTPASNSLSMPGLISIWAISVTMCAPGDCDDAASLARPAPEDHGLRSGVWVAAACGATTEWRAEERNRTSGAARGRDMRGEGLNSRRAMG